MTTSRRHYNPAETDDGQDERFLKPLDAASRQSVAGLLDDLLVLADAEDDPEAAAALRMSLAAGDREEGSN